MSEEKLIKEALKDLQESLVGQGVKYNTISDILNKINNAGLVRSDRTPRVLVNKRYMFSFVEGGWNTVWAKTKKGAIKIAIKQYKSNENLTPIPSSFHKETPKSLKSALSLFY